MSAFLDLYEPLDIIGNGSFGIIRKVRRKSDGLVFARKELNFERMSERDRKQIVAEVNILKDLHHEHIVRYHDRHVDRDAGILYILMEYCGGGDLSTVIKQAQKHSRAIPEDTIWNYFMQILLALHHCHHPNGHGRSGSTGGASDVDGKDKRAQILHRDLKPDNVFLDEANLVKLGDFGLSKALAQASFANTYVGTPYYMSPELMQEKAYDSKSDIWSLGCLIYELCALKPPFHEAKTHAELSIFIRNGRIPPLPRGYSQSLSAVIKAMLNLNPAMRPSAAQLLQHERLELVFKVSETEKMLATVKTHKATMVAKEREVLAREAAIAEKEARTAALLSERDAEIASLQYLRTQVLPQQNLEALVRDAVSKREEELRIAVAKREEEVAFAIALREKEILEAVRRREEEIFHAWTEREEQIRAEMSEAIEEKVQWVTQRVEELREEEEKIERGRCELERKLLALAEVESKGKKEKTPLEEVKNLLTPPAHRKEQRETSYADVVSKDEFPVVETPVNRIPFKLRKNLPAPSAMKGVVLTTTGEPLATPSPAELAHLFDKSPKVGLNFTKIFDFDSEAGDDSDQGESDIEGPFPSPSKPEKPKTGSLSNPTSGESTPEPTLHPPTRLRRPSIRRSLQRGSKPRAQTLPSTISDPEEISSGSQCKAPSSTRHPQPSSASGPSLSTVTSTSSYPSLEPPQYDLDDDENLPSPFLKRIDREREPPPASTTVKEAPKRRQSGLNSLRATAVVNSANRAATVGKAGVKESASTRPSLTSARKASEDARKALSRP